MDNNNNNSIQSKFVNWISGLKNKMTETIMSTLGTKEELDETIDEKIPVIQRVKKYFDSPSLIHRLYLSKELIDFAKQMSYEDAKKLLVPLIFKLIHDSDPLVRQTLLEQFFGFGQYMIKHKESNEEDYTQIILNSLLRLTAELTTDENQQTRTSAVEILVMFGGIIKQEEKLPYLIPIIKSLSKDKTEEDHRVQGAILLGRLAESLGAQNIETYVFTFFEQLANDQSPKVKKAVASQIRNLINVLKEKNEMIERIYQIFIVLTSDEVWGVRKACCESFDIICHTLDGDQHNEKRQKLTEIYLNLLSDDSRWVKSVAYQYLGHFISSFKVPENVSEELLENYMNMPNKAVINGDGQLSLHCAFSFPAVFLTLGKDSWDKLGGLYKTLESDMQFKVRRCLAFSLHEIAKIMGTENCENNLISTFDLFFSDVEEVKIGVITNLVSFISVLSPRRRNEYLQYVREIQKEPAKWRLRKLISSQISQLVDLYDPKRVFEIIYPITINLINDNVCSVRKKAYKGFAKIIQIFSANENYLNYFEKVRDQLFELVESSFQKRQSFAYICGELVDLIPINIFEEMFFEKIKSLCSDRVTVVRIAVADAFDRAHQRNHNSEENNDKLKLISSVLLLLSNDKDFDVNHLSNKHTGKEWIPYGERPYEERIKTKNLTKYDKNYNNYNDHDSEDYSEDD